MNLLSFSEFFRLVCCRLHGEIIKTLIKSVSTWSHETNSNMEGIVFKPAICKKKFLLIRAFLFELYYEVSLGYIQSSVSEGH